MPLECSKAFSPLLLSYLIRMQRISTSFPSPTKSNALAKGDVSYLLLMCVCVRERKRLDDTTI
jgi:hypothetical protein